MVTSRPISSTAQKSGPGWDPRAKSQSRIAGRPEGGIAAWRGLRLATADSEHARLQVQVVEVEGDHLAAPQAAALDQG